jgi:hypothetical protein
VALEADDQRFARASDRVVLYGPNLDALTNIVVAQAAKLGADKIFQVDHLGLIEFGRLVIYFLVSLGFVGGRPSLLLQSVNILGRLSFHAW